ncbi:MAG: efflux RND transporter periplasmic adaptor subunit [Bryobacteraceae bacterium]|jgi:cobalt-zinc-cadmium efflux system membrane fusion protein
MKRRDEVALARASACVALSVALGLAFVLALSGCSAQGKGDPKAEAPPPAQVERVQSAGLFKVDDPAKFPLVAAGQISAAPELNVTGVVGPDISRTIPVITLASGRVIEVLARLGDTVTKGQLLMKVQSADIAGAYSDYEQALADQTLAKAQLDRSKILFDKGAIAQKDLEVAQDTATKAQVTVKTTLDHLRVLGADPDRPSAIVEVRAPAAGVITDQQVTTAAGVQGLASPNPFTISDLSHIWVLCDVYENDLSQVHLDEYADVRLNAYPDRVFKGRIGNISPVLDANLHTAKVRLEMPNPEGSMRLGMFVTSTFHGLKKETHATVPAPAVLHLHDRDWVYVPVDGGQFRRLEVTGGKMLPGNLQEIVAGVRPGQQVVSNALVLQATAEQ